MECRTCSEVLTAFMDGELTGAEEKDVEQHLDDCSACLTEYDSLLFAYKLTDQFSNRLAGILEPEARSWSRIQSRLGAAAAEPGIPAQPSSVSTQPKFRLKTTWLPFALAAGVLMGVSMPLFWSSDDAVLEQHFISWVEARERLEQQHQHQLRINHEQAWDRVHPNPFVAESIQGNPFAE